MSSELQNAFDKMVFSNDAKDLIVDYSELAIDNVVDEGVFKEIPFIKTIVGIYKTGIGIRERFTLKKIAKFLFCLKGVSHTEKEGFLLSLSTNKRYKNEVVEKLLVLLDRIDDVDKAEIIGNLFKATIRENISLSDFLKLSFVVDNAYITDLKTFCYWFDSELDFATRSSLQEKYWLSGDIQKSLASLGLMEEKLKVNDRNVKHFDAKYPNYDITYNETQLGRIFAKHAKPSIKQENGSGGVSL